MSADQLALDMTAGTRFWGYEIDGILAAVMGFQPSRDVDLVRHAYVLQRFQGHGVGGALLEHLETGNDRQILIGTWAAADWAIGFYRRYGYEQASVRDASDLLRRYWTVSARQIETSVVLAKPAYRPAPAPADR